MNLTLARLIDAIEAAPHFPFGEDLRRANEALDRGSILWNSEAAKHIETLIEGASNTPGFPFGADLQEARNDLAEYEKD